jgi:hypothetical protein
VLSGVMSSRKYPGANPEPVFASIHLVALVIQTLNEYFSNSEQIWIRATIGTQYRWRRFRTNAVPTGLLICHGSVG